MSDSGGSHHSSSRFNRVVRCTTVAAVVVVAAVAAVISFSHMQTVAARAGEGWRSWLIPASVDGLIAAAGMVLLVRRRAGLSGGWLPWVSVITGAIASLACNVAAAESTITARLVAVWPPANLEIWATTRLVWYFSTRIFCFE